MKKCSLYTLNGNYNYGNKLQHYALQFYLSKMNIKTETVYCYLKRDLKSKIKDIIKFFVRKRYRNFVKFDHNINYSKMYVYKNKIYNKINYDYHVVGSDQVWNTNFDSYNRAYLLSDINIGKKISYASSFGTNNLSTKYVDEFSINLKKFDAISVREESGKKIIENLVGRNDIQVLIDPTMLLTAEEWDKVTKKPRQLKKIKNKKYILVYFLGHLSNSRKSQIEKIAQENDCHIIYLLNKKDPFYTCGPSEFLYLEKNAFLIFTDSFHSSVFAIIYNRPFIVYDRDDSNISMNSRIDTLINKFKLTNRKYNGINITNEIINHDYTDAYKVLEKERKKAEKFLKNALDIVRVKVHE